MALTQAWAGKAAPLDPIDYRERSWVPYSGWPLTADELSPYNSAGVGCLLTCLAKLLDSADQNSGRQKILKTWATESFDHTGGKLQNHALIQWTFYRIGREFLRKPRQTSGSFFAQPRHGSAQTNSHASRGVDVACLEGRRADVEAKMVVLAASGIENPRLL